jgi:hypothetical protein
MPGYRDDPTRRPGRTRRRAAALLGVGLALALAGGACSSGAGPAASTTSTAAPGSGAGCIKNEQGDGCLPVAPDRQRVDLAKPSFSDPTRITNPRFPVGELAQVIHLGEEAGEPLRFEVSRLPGTRTVTWDGRQVETVVSQFVAYLDGRVLEVALDYFAQADDGAIWYFGEDVDNYEDGVVANHDGSWLAGEDGPPGMIMPADPKPGDVYRPENLPGVVFEQVTVRATGQTVDGPRGPVEGAVLVRELLMDGTTEEKTFAPGYGEFRARARDELVTVALAVPTDALPGPVPAGLDSLATGAADVVDTAPSRRWGAVAASVRALTAAWDAHRAGDVPELLATQMADALDALTSAVAAGNPAGVRQAAVGVAGAALDLRLRHRPAAEVDLARLQLWARQLQVDTAARDGAAVAGDVATIATIWDRVGHAVDPAAAARVKARLGDLRAAVDDVTAAAAAAPALLRTLAGLRPAGG